MHTLETRWVLPAGELALEALAADKDAYQYSDHFCTICGDYAPWPYEPECAHLRMAWNAIRMQTYIFLTGGNR